jgi:hypothetical protein
LIPQFPELLVSFVLGGGPIGLAENVFYDKSLFSGALDVFRPLPKSALWTLLKETESEKVRRTVVQILVITHDPYKDPGSSLFQELLEFLATTQDSDLVRYAFDTQKHLSVHVPLLSKLVQDWKTTSEFRGKAIEALGNIEPDSPVASQALETLTTWYTQAQKLQTFTLRECSGDLVRALMNFGSKADKVWDLLFKHWEEISKKPQNGFFDRELEKNLMAALVQIRPSFWDTVQNTLSSWIQPKDQEKLGHAIEILQMIDPRLASKVLPQVVALFPSWDGFSDRVQRTLVTFTISVGEEIPETLLKSFNALLRQPTDALRALVGLNLPYYRREGIGTGTAAVIHVMVFSTHGLIATGESFGDEDKVRPAERVIELAINHPGLMSDCLNVLTAVGSGALPIGSSQLHAALRDGRLKNGENYNEHHFSRISEALWRAARNIYTLDPQ